MRHGAARFAKNILQETRALPIQIRSAWKSVVDPRAVAEGRGFGPGVLDLTARGVRDTPAVRFSEIARASSRRARAPGRRQLFGPGQRIVVLFHLQMVVAHLGGGAKCRYPTTLLCQVATAFCAIPCIRCTSSARRPPPPRLSFHEGLAMGQYEGEADCIGTIVSAARRNNLLCSSA